MEGFSLLLFFSFLSSLLLTSKAISTIGANHNISDGDTIVSDDENFELGFFTPSNSSRNRYLGIWYKKIQVHTVVWVANRETPLNDTSGVLVLNNGGILMLINGTNDTIWSSNSSVNGRNPVAQLLDTGNLVIRNENDIDPQNYLWQSFDYIGNTFLPSMKFGKDFVKGIDRYLTAWKSDDDPSPGEFTNRFDSNGYPQILMRKGSDVQYSSGPWNGLRFSGMPNLKPNGIYTFGFVLNENELYYKYELVNSSVLSRMILSPSGSIQRFIWVERTQEWLLYVTGQMDNCDRYGLCGAYGICNINNSPACGCLRGFKPKFPEEWNIADWSNGCERKTELNCEGDGFMKQTSVKLPDTRRTLFNVSMNLEECEMMCLRNCNCTAYANTDVRGGGSGCLIWLNELIDIRSYADAGQDIYIRMAASELNRKAKAKRRVRIILIPILLTMAVLLGLGLFAYKRRKQKRKGNASDIPNTPEHPIITGITRFDRRKTFTSENEGKDWELPLFDFNTIANATSNFSDDCKVGEGGFGPVYKGLLEEGQEIAVKRHSRKSKQGLDEFQNEVHCIAKLQHRNLVKLLGCCIEEGERMLIYEYMPNRSLNSFIFDEEKRKSLDWPKRYSIISGIARGLLYLHQDSRLRVIHRDLKASNILLDKELNPKISDFGLARSLEGSDTEANTRRIMGTYGYMSPEYTIDGIFSTKSDIFSFGVLVLEIVSGTKNRGFRHANHNLNLLGHTWRLYQNRKSLELIDEEIKNSYNLSEVERAIHIGLLCVQKYPEDRPGMPSVVLMLSSDIPLPEPKQPGFYTERRRPQEADSSSSNLEWSSSNRLTVTHLEPR